MRPFSTVGSNGASMPAVPTVSMCALRRSVRPPPDPRDDPDSVEPPGATSSTSASRPASSSQRATKRAISPSPAAPGDQVGIDRVDPDQLRDELDEGAARHYA